MEYFLYILRSSTNDLYIGQTNNLSKRVHEHAIQSSKSAKFVRDNGKFELIYHERFQSRGEAMRRENQLKGWSRAKKEALIAGNINLLKILSKKK